MHLNLMVILEILIIAVVGFVLYTIARRGIRTMERRNLLSLQSSVILTGVLKWPFIVAIVFSALNAAGLSAAAIWASLSAVLMLVALGFVAVWSILSNASCALFLVAFSPFRIGDEIEVLDPSNVNSASPGLRGKVIKISFIYTTLLETLENGERNKVHLPNNQLFQNAVRCRSGKNTTSLKQALFDNGSPVPETLDEVRE